MIGNQGFSARTRAAVRVCSLLAPLAAVTACTTNDSADSRESITTRSVGVRAMPESSAVPPPTEGAMGQATFAKGQEGAAGIGGGAGRPADGISLNGPASPVDLNTLGLRGASRMALSAPTATLTSGVVGHRAGKASLAVRASPAAVAAAAAAPRPAPCMPGDPLCSSANGAAQSGMFGLLPAASAANPGTVWQPDVRDAPVAPALARLDPNARYATTYRPGGAALAAFDAAVARGQIPTSYKDLVGEFGARYAPALEAPKDGALAIAVNTARAAVGPEGGPVNLLVALASSDAMPSRAPLSVHIVLDVSGSMSGKAIEDAKKAAEAAVDKLESDRRLLDGHVLRHRKGHRRRRAHRSAARPGARAHSRSAGRRRHQHLGGARISDMPRPARRPRATRRCAS